MEVVQKMNDLHEFIDKKGVRWSRIFVNPCSSADTRADPWSHKDWMRRTNKRMTAGEMMDEAAQLSEKRAKDAGVDHVKKKIFDDYEKKTGKPHRDSIPDRIETRDYVLEF